MISDSQFDALLDSGIEALRGQTSLYALIDPTLEEIVDSGISGLLHDLPMQKLNISCLPKDKRPYLLSLGDYDVHERQIGSLLYRALQEASGVHDRENVRPRSVCSFFRTVSPSPAHLTAKMADAAEILTRDRQRMVFRYWDPRIASQLTRLFGEQFFGQQLRCFGIDTWWCYEPSKSVPVLAEISAKQLASGEEVICEDGWQFNQERMQKLEILSWANRVSVLVSNWGIKELPELPQLENIVTRALRYGLQTEVDILRFSFAALTIHSNFDKHPVVARMLSESPSFARAMQGWSADFTDELRSGTWLTGEQDEQPQNGNE